MDAVGRLEDACAALLDCAFSSRTAGGHQRIFRLLFAQDYHLLTYGKLYQITGIITTYGTGETVGGITLGRIDVNIGRLKPKGNPLSTGPTWILTRKFLILSKMVGADLGGMDSATSHAMRSASGMGNPGEVWGWPRLRL